MNRSSRPEVFLWKGVLKICSKFTWEHPCQSVILIKLHGCPPINLLHIFKTSFTKNSSGWLLLYNSTKELLKNNIINAYVFEAALQDLLTNRRRNSRNITSYGPANSRKTSTLNLSPLFLKYLLIQLLAVVGAEKTEAFPLMISNDHQTWYLGKSF